MKFAPNREWFVSIGPSRLQDAVLAGNTLEPQGELVMQKCYENNRYWRYDSQNNILAVVKATSGLLKMLLPCVGNDKRA